MLESIQKRLADVQAKVREYEQLAGHLAETQKTLAAEASRLMQLREQLKKEYRDAAARVLAGSEPPDRLGRPAGPGAHRQIMAEYDAAVVKHGEVAKAVAAAASEANQLRSRLAAAVRVLAKPQPAPHEEVPVAEVVEEPVAVMAGAATPRPGHLEGGATPTPEKAPDAVPVSPAHEAGPMQASAAKPSKAIAQPADADALQTEEQALAEAVATGRQVLDDLDRCIHLVEEVFRGGKWHLITSAISSKSADHAKIDEARRAAHNVRENLRRFNGQVADLRRQFGGRLGHGDAATLGDRFLGTLIGEGHPGTATRRAVAGGETAPPHALESAHEAYHEVRAICARLQLEASAARARRAARERRQVAQAG